MSVKERIAMMNSKKTENASVAPVRRPSSHRVTTKAFPGTPSTLDSLPQRPASVAVVGKIGKPSFLKEGVNAESGDKSSEKPATPSQEIEETSSRRVSLSLKERMAMLENSSGKGAIEPIGIKPSPKRTSARIIEDATVANASPPSPPMSSPQAAASDGTPSENKEGEVKPPPTPTFMFGVEAAEHGAEDPTTPKAASQPISGASSPSPTLVAPPVDMSPVASALEQMSRFLGEESGGDQVVEGDSVLEVGAAGPGVDTSNIETGSNESGKRNSIERLRGNLLKLPGMTSGQPFNPFGRQAMRPNSRSLGCGSGNGAELEQQDAGEEGEKSSAGMDMGSGSQGVTGADSSTRPELVHQQMARATRVKSTRKSATLQKFTVDDD